MKIKIQRDCKLVQKTNDDNQLLTTVVLDIFRISTKVKDFYRCSGLPSNSEGITTACHGVKDLVILVKTSEETKMEEVDILRFWDKFVCYCFAICYLNFQKLLVH